jgi:hypothetical protein
MALMYKSVFTMNEIAYLFWFYTGVVARSAHVERAARRAASGSLEAVDRRRFDLLPGAADEVQRWRPGNNGAPSATLR